MGLCIFSLDFKEKRMEFDSISFSFIATSLVFFVNLNVIVQVKINLIFGLCIK